MKPLKLSYLLILLVSVLLLSGASGNQNQTLENVRSDEHEPTPNNIETSPDTEPKPPTPFQAETLEALRAIAKQQKSVYEQYRAEQKTWQSPEVYISIALFIVAAVYTWFAYGQWYQISRTADIANEGIIEARRAAIAAQQSAAVAERSLVLLERAWLDIGIEPFPLQITPGAVTINIRNTGRTPALIKMITIPPPQYAYDRPVIEIMPKPTEYLPTIAIVPANQTIEWEVEAGSMIDSKVGNKGSYLIVHGCIVYDDHLGNRHFTRFYRQRKQLKDGKTGFIIAKDDPPEYNKAD